MKKLQLPTGTARIPVMLFGAMVLGGLLWGCENENDPKQAGGPSGRRAAGPVPQQHSFDFRLIETRDGIRQWVLESEEMLEYSGQEDLLLVQLKMDFFQHGAYHSTLTADSGRANKLTRDVHAWGEVVVVTEDGRKLETEELFFDNERELIHNDVFDRLTRDGDVVTGIGLEATPDLEYIELKENVNANVGDDDTPGGGSGDR